MSVKRWNAKRDANEPEILEAIRRVGGEAITLDAFDLLVLYRGKLFMLDCKMPTGRITAGQERLTARGWPLRYVTSPDEALRAIGAVK